MNRRDFFRMAASAPLFSTAFGAEAKDVTSPTATRKLPALPSFIRAKRRVDDLYWKNFEVDSISNHPLLLDDSIPTELSPYGGDRSRKFKATGFFRTEKAADRWWLVDPEGCAFLSTGLNSFRPVAPGSDASRAEKRYGKGAAGWADSEVPRLKSWGFNTAGCWSDETLLQATQQKVVHTPIRWPGWQDLDSPLEAFSKEKKLDSGNLFYGGILPIFSDEFEKFVNENALRLSLAKNDPWIMGWFLDNELSHPNLQAHLAYDGADPSLRVACAVARQWLETRKKGIELKTVTQEDYEEWAGVVYERYLSIIVPAMRKHDPNHLVLSPRLTGSAIRSEPVLKAIGRWCDVLCINLYAKWTVPPDLAALWETSCGKPVIISEWYAKGADSGMKNTAGVGFLVETQRDRSHFYQNFILQSLRLKSVVGWHWHRYMDNDPSGKEIKGSNTDANKGLVTSDFEAYQLALAGIAQLNHQIYRSARYFQPQPI